jgi:hypothetical protein
VDMVESVRESGQWGKASHRGHRGHEGGGWTLWLPCGNRANRKASHTEVTEGAVERLIPFAHRSQFPLCGLR